MQKLINILLISILSINLAGCVGDNIAEEMNKSNMQIKDLKNQIVILNDRLIAIQHIEKNFDQFTLLLLKIVEILEKLPKEDRQNILDNMPTSQRNIIMKLMKEKQ